MTTASLPRKQTVRKIWTHCYVRLDIERMHSLSLLCKLTCCVSASQITSTCLLHDTIESLVEDCEAYYSEEIEETEARDTRLI